MIEIPIPKEIKDYKPKYLFKLTFRQNVSVVVMLLINIPLYKYGKVYINTELLSWIMIFISVPIIAIGFFKYNEMNFEEFLLAFIQSEFIYPKKRVYKNENIYLGIKELLIKERLEKEDEVKKKKSSKRKKKKKERPSNEKGSDK